MRKNGYAAFLSRAFSYKTARGAMLKKPVYFYWWSDKKRSIRKPTNANNKFFLK